MEVTYNKEKDCYTCKHNFAVCPDCIKYINDTSKKLITSEPLLTITHSEAGILYDFMKNEFLPREVYHELKNFLDKLDKFVIEKKNV